MIFSGIKQMGHLSLSTMVGQQVIKLAGNGISSGTCVGKGASENHLLELLGISDIRKEIVHLVSEKAIYSKQ